MLGINFATRIGEDLSLYLHAEVSVATDITLSPGRARACRTCQFVRLAVLSARQRDWSMGQTYLKGR